MLVRRGNGNRAVRRLASDFSKKGSGKSASGSSPLFAVLSCALSRPLYRRRPRRPSGKSNNATCRFRLIYSRYPLEGLSTCKARVVICSHLERIGLRSPRSRKSLSRRALHSELHSESLHFLLPRPSFSLSALFSLRYFASSSMRLPPSRFGATLCGGNSLSLRADLSFIDIYKYKAARGESNHCTFFFLYTSFIPPPLKELFNSLPRFKEMYIFYFLPLL